MLSIIVSFNTQAQSRVADSLIRLLSVEQVDTTRSLLLSRLSYTYMNNNPDTALILAREGYLLATRANYGPVESFSLNMLGNVFYSKGNNAKALEFYLKALKVSELLAVDRVGLILANISIVYSSAGDYRKSLQYLFRAKEIMEKRKDTFRLAATYLNFGDNYEKLNLLDSARFFTIIANDFSTKTQRRATLALSIINMGNIYFKMNEPAIALAYYRSAWVPTKAIEDESSLSEIEIGMARAFEKVGQMDSSLHFAGMSLRRAQQAHIIPEIWKASTFLADYYRKLNIVDSAYNYLQITIAAKDTMFNEESRRQFEALSFDETMRERQLENEKLEAESERHQNIQYAAIAIGVLCFGIIFLLLSRSVIVNEKWIRFLGILGLLLVFELINLFIHPLLSDLTNHSPLLMLVIMVVIAALIIPLHHRIEHWIIHKMTHNNRKIRLSAAKRTVAKLEGTIQEE